MRAYRRRRLLARTPRSVLFVFLGDSYSAGRK